MTHNIIASFHKYFVTWPPFIIVYRYEKGGQVTKPIILMKIYAMILYVIQGVTNI